MSEVELPDYDNADEDGKDGASGGLAKSAAGISASGFKDFLLKPELLQATVDCGFENPSEVQHACLPQAMLGTDVLARPSLAWGRRPCSSSPASRTWI